MTKFTLAASVFALVLSFYSQALANEETTNKEFLTWEKSQQDSFIAISVLTASVIATQVKQEMAECIGRWYNLANGGSDARHAQILDIMTEYPDNIPSGIVVAVIQKECGKFGDS